MEQTYLIIIIIQIQLDIGVKCSILFNSVYEFLVLLILFLVIKGLMKKIQINNYFNNQITLGKGQNTEILSSRKLGEDKNGTSKKTKSAVIAKPYKNRNKCKGKLI